MSRIQWTKEHEVNVRLIDEQHKSLMEAMAKLEELTRQKAAHREIEKALDELALRTRRHFFAEEQLMEAHDYPDRHNHTHGAHVRLLADIINVISDYRSGSQQLKTKTLKSLEKALVGHIIDEKELGAFLSSKGVK